jgi:hypothetical protein
VTEQLCPRSLLLVRRVPCRAAAPPVVSTLAKRRVGVGRERMACRSLMPEASGDLPRRDRRDSVGAERQT